MTSSQLLSNSTNSRFPLGVADVAPGFSVGAGRYNPTMCLSSVWPQLVEMWGVFHQSQANPRAVYHPSRRYLMGQDPFSRLFVWAGKQPETTQQEAGLNKGTISGIKRLRLEIGEASTCYCTC